MNTQAMSEIWERFTAAFLERYDGKDKLHHAVARALVVGSSPDSSMGLVLLLGVDRERWQPVFDLWVEHCRMARELFDAQRLGCDLAN